MQSWQILIVAVVFYFAFNKWNMRRAAKRSMRIPKELYSTQHEFEARSPESIRDLDHEAYANFKKHLDARDFLWLGDIKDTTMTRILPSMRTVLRLMISAGGTVMASGYHFKVRRLMKLLVKVAGTPTSQFFFGFETEFSNGTFLCTSNGMLAGRTKEFEGIKRVFLKTDSIDELLATHLRLVEQLTETDSLTRPLEMHTLPEFMASQARMQMLKNKAKAARGYIDAEEVARIANPGQELAAERLGAEIEKIKRKEEKA